MKNTFTLIVFLVFTLSSIGQNTFQSSKDSKNIKEKVKEKIQKLDQINIDNLVKANTVLLQQLDSVIMEYVEDEVWYMDQKVIYTYLANGLCTEMLYLVMEDEWIGEEKENYFYDENNKLIQDVVSYLNEEGTAWEEYAVMDFSYDPSGLSTEVIITYTYEDEVEIEKAELYYDEDGMLLETIMYYQDIDWQAYSRDTYTVNEELLQYEEFSYYKEGDDWFNNFQQIGKCNAEWQQYESNAYYFNDEINDWENAWKVDFIYDEFGNIQRENDFEWNEELNTWDLYASHDLNYNNEYSFDQLILPYDYISDDPSSRFINYLNHMLLVHEYSYINYETNEIELAGRDHYYYSEQDIQGLNQMPKLEARIYPNPANDYIQVEMDTQMKPIQLQILDIQGRVVIEESVKNHQAISISKLSSGFYTYRLMSDRAMTSGQIIKH